MPRPRLDRRIGVGYTCIVTQLSIRRPRSPRQAAARSSPLDRRLDARLFRALADPTRLHLLACLAKCARPATVGEIAACCRVDLSVVSRHLRLLEAAGVLMSERRGRLVLYAVRTADVCAVLRAIADALEQCCPPGESGCCADACATACAPTPDAAAPPPAGKEARRARR